MRNITKKNFMGFILRTMVMLPTIVIMLIFMYSVTTYSQSSYNSYVAKCQENELQLKNILEASTSIMNVKFPILIIDPSGDSLSISGALSNIIDVGNLTDLLLDYGVCNIDIMNILVVIILLVEILNVFVLVLILKYFNKLNRQEHE